MSGRSRKLRGKDGQLLPWRRRLRPFEAFGHLVDVGDGFDLLDLPVIGPLLVLLLLPVLVLLLVPLAVVVVAGLVELAAELLLCPFVWAWHLARSR